jgi:outer membrane protein assembly factor BamB
MTRRQWLSSLASFALAGSARAADWPLWGGFRHNFTADETPLAATWPASGPREIWRRPLGDGYSGIACVEGRLYTMAHRAMPYWLVFTEQQEVAMALDAATGETVWEYAYQESFRSQFSEIGPGPYAMPQVVGDRVFTAGAGGKLKALQRRDGALLWERDLYEELGGTRLPYGYSSHAVPYKDNLLVLAGGERQGLACLSQATGETVWAKLGFQNAHSTPILITVDGQEQLVALAGKMIFGADPATGEMLWSRSHSTDYGLAIAMPIWAPDRSLLVYSAAYNFGAEALRLRQSAGKTTVEPVWRDKRLQLHFDNMILADGALYFTRGHSGPAFFTAVDLETGRELWQTRDVAKSSLLALPDGRILILDETGLLAIATATRERLTIHAKHKILSEKAWTPPTLVDGRLYVRDRAEIAAFDLSA